MIMMMMVVVVVMMCYQNKWLWKRMTNRTQNSEENIIGVHNLHISDTKLPVESYRYCLKDSELYKINDIKKMHHTEVTVSCLQDSCMKTTIFPHPSFFPYLSSS
jgi:hypothetical protein